MSYACLVRLTKCMLDLEVVLLKEKIDGFINATVKTALTLTFRY